MPRRQHHRPLPPRGVPYVAAVETTTETPAETADEINLIWIYGFIDLVAADRAAGPQLSRRRLRLLSG